ncbi:hypothetical protein C8R44DRAFT_888811 [Mycena epipterygia]|nr:hypothetical protein C8R44DRAFT_888811 [Mycena epipterygia]
MLPLQLGSEFGWHTLPAVAVAASMYLGFVAVAEEIEQPFGGHHLFLFIYTQYMLQSSPLFLFIILISSLQLAGYDENGVHLDMFCCEIVC